MQIHFTLDNSAFRFQSDNRFFLHNITQMRERLCLENFSCDDNILNDKCPRFSDDDNIYIDARIPSDHLSLLINSIKNKISISNEYGYMMLTFRNNNTISLNESYFNPQCIYSKILSRDEQYISPKAKILSGAHIIGNCYIGDDCLIGHNALIRDSYIDDGAIIGYNTEVNKSYIGRKSTLHTNFIGHSIVGDDCHFGYISCTTVIRLDGNNITLKSIDKTHSSKELKMGAFIEYGCQIGAYVALMPGVMIGMKSVIFPYTKINIAIPRQSYCKLSHQLEVDTLKEVLETSNYDIYEKQLREEIAKVDQSENTES